MNNKSDSSPGRPQKEQQGVFHHASIQDGQNSGRQNADKSNTISLGLTLKDPRPQVLFKKEKFKDISIIRSVLGLKTHGQMDTALKI